MLKLYRVYTTRQEWKQMEPHVSKETIQSPLHKNQQQFKKG